MDKVFIYWDNSNIFHEAQRLAMENNSGPDARYRVRIDFANMFRLAHADRPVERAIAAGSVPPEMRQLWNRLENQGIEVRLFNRVRADSGEQQIPDTVLQLQMLRDALRHNGDPGIVVLLRETARDIRRERASTSRWSRCSRRDGGLRFCRGNTRATSVCAVGLRRTARSSRWTTSTIR